MVRSLTPTLSAALAATTRIPAIGITIEDHTDHWRLFQSPLTPDSWNDACVASDQSIIRVRVTRGSNAFAQSFQWQRVTNPAISSQWSTWTTFGGGSATCFQDGGCAVSNNGGLLRAFAQQGSGGNALWCWSSTDNGLTWSATPATVLSPPASALIKGLGSAGNNDIFFLYDVIGGEKVGCSFYSSGWSALNSYSLVLQAGAGIDAIWDGVHYWLVYSDSASLGLLFYSSSVWGSYPLIAPATNTVIGRIAPRLSYDAMSSTYHLVCVEADTGAYSGAVYSYPRLRQSSDLIHWSQGTIAHDMSTFYGACLLITASTRYLISTPTILSAATYTPTSSTYLDVSQCLLSYRLKEQIGMVGQLELVLDNAGGALSALISQPGATQPLGPNCLVRLNEGYCTGTPPVGAETIKTGSYRINRVTVQRSPREHQLRLLCSACTSQLDHMNRFQITYQNQSLGWLIKEICARAGLLLTVLPATSQMSEVIATFVLQANSAYRIALDELCNTYSLLYFLDQDEVMQFREIAATDAPVMTYQPEVEQISFGLDDGRANHIIVTGKPPGSTFVGALTTAEAYDDVHMHWVGSERLLCHVDPKLTTSAQCASKAAFLLAREQQAQHTYQVTVPLNPALQLLDVVTLTDYAVPVGSGQGGNARIIRIQTSYEAQHAVYTMTLELEGVES